MSALRAARRGWSRGYHRGLARSWRWQLKLIQRFGDPNPVLLAHWHVKIQREEAAADGTEDN